MHLCTRRTGGLFSYAGEERTRIIIRDYQSTQSLKHIDLEYYIILENQLYVKIMSK